MMTTFSPHVSFLYSVSLQRRRGRQVHPLWSYHHFCWHPQECLRRQPFHRTASLKSKLFSSYFQTVRWGDTKEDWAVRVISLDGAGRREWFLVQRKLLASCSRRQRRGTAQNNELIVTFYGSCIQSFGFEIICFILNEILNTIAISIRLRIIWINFCHENVTCLFNFDSIVCLSCQTWYCT